MTIIEQLDTLRIEATKKLDQSRRGELGQFMTPTVIASFMASLFLKTRSSIRILDPGAGIGSLSIALLAQISNTRKSGGDISLTAYEIDEKLILYLKQNIKSVKRFIGKKNINLDSKIVDKDFILDEIKPKIKKFTHAILNPPYKKINTDSDHRRALRKIGQEHVNLYSAFVGKSLELLANKGQLVAIIPRSFCNGLYYKPFRKYLLENAAIKQIHLFESRTHSFKDDEVLQENVIIHLQKGVRQEGVIVSHSSDPNLKSVIEEIVPFDSIVKKDDSEIFIHIPDITQSKINVEDEISHSLQDIGLQISTGPVVDFRVKEYLSTEPIENSMPLLYATHFNGNGIEWPKVSKKPNALVINETTLKASIPNGFYTIVKRFSSKEEKQRIVARVIRPDNFDSDVIGLENHLNYFHSGKQGIDENLAYGIAAFLNTSYVDKHFRTFNGHTQVNATDLRQLKYPSREKLIEIGSWAKEIENFIPENLDHRIMATQESNEILQALEIIKALDLPKAQHNERSALILLALLNIVPGKPWMEAESPLIGITPIMEFTAKNYGKEYKPNTRETVRDETVKPFVEAGILLRNPDKLDRSVNSPNTVYQIEPTVLGLIHNYGTNKWKQSLNEYLKVNTGLATKYAKERDMLKVPVVIAKGKKIELSAGDHSVLIKAIIEDFAPIFAQGSKLIYVGDTGKKWGYFDKELLEKLGVHVDVHGKMPDVVLYYPKKNWLLLVESVTSTGHVDGKRHDELKRLFGKSKAGLVYVTAFPSRQMMAQYTPVIAWETEAWCADAPTHIIHFNGIRFLGPYE